MVTWKVGSRRRMLPYVGTYSTFIKLPDKEQIYNKMAAAYGHSESFAEFEKRSDASKIFNAMRADLIAGGKMENKQ